MPRIYFECSHKCSQMSGRSSMVLQRLVGAAAELGEVV